MITYVTHGAMVSRLDVILAVVAGVDELVLALVVQFVEHAQCTELGPAKGREFKVLVAGHREERIATVHQVTVDERIRILDGLQMGR